MQSIRVALDAKEENRQRILIHAYCVMGNHYHQSSTYRGGSSALSDYMRQCHGRFGARYNRKHGRSGKVAEDRPKTALVQDEAHSMRVHFYIEANPIRAGLCKLGDLARYKYSSYRFYAYGFRDENTSLLTIPGWYLRLGRTMRQRQRAYRRLFAAYVGECGLNCEGNFVEARKDFVGTEVWMHLQRERVFRGEVNTG